MYVQVPSSKCNTLQITQEFNLARWSSIACLLSQLISQKYQVFSLFFHVYGFLRKYWCCMSQKCFCRPLQAPRLNKFQSEWQKLTRNTCTWGGRSVQGSPSLYMKDYSSVRMHVPVHVYYCASLFCTMVMTVVQSDRFVWESIASNLPVDEKD